MTAASDFSWLADHQLHVLESLGYIDDLMEDVAAVLRDESRIGVFTFIERQKGDLD